MFSRSGILKKDIFIILLIGFVLLNGLVWAFSIPLNGAPNEFDHYRLTKFISQHNRLPVLKKDLDFYFMSMITKMPVTEGEIKLHKENKIFQNTFLYEFKPLYMMWPCGPYLFFGLFAKLGAICPQVGDYYFARLFSVLCAGLIVFFLYDLAKKIFPDDNYIPKMSAVFAGLIPQFTFLSGYINPDIPTALFTTLLLVGWFYCLQAKFSLTSACWLGVFFGAVVMGKISGYSLLGLTAIFLAFFLRKGFQENLKFVVVAGLGAFVVTGWFFIRNFILYQDASGYFANIQAMNEFFKRTSPFIRQHDIFTALQHMHYGLRAVPYLLNFCFSSFWGVFPGMTLVLPKGFYILVYGLSLLSLLGFIAGCVRDGKKILANKILTLILSVFWIQILLVMFYVFMGKSQPQGQYLHAVIAPMAILFSYGWLGWCKEERHQKIIFIALSGILFGLNIFSFFYCQSVRYFQPIF